MLRCMWSLRLEDLTNCLAAEVDCFRSFLQLKQEKYELMEVIPNISSPRNYVKVNNFNKTVFCSNVQYYQLNETELKW